MERTEMIARLELMRLVAIATSIREKALSENEDLTNLKILSDNLKTRKEMDELYTEVLNCEKAISKIRREYFKNRCELNSKIKGISKRKLKEKKEQVNNRALDLIEYQKKIDAMWDELKSSVDTLNYLRGEYADCNIGKNFNFDSAKKILNLALNTNVSVTKARYFSTVQKAASAGIVKIKSIKIKK